MIVELITDGYRRFHVSPDGYDAILGGVRRCESLGLHPVRVRSNDWVTLADIARRTRRSRETVRLWSLGDLGPDGFPPPLNPGAAVSFYSWVEVSCWLRGAGHAVPSTEPVLTAMNLAVQLRYLAPRITRMDAVLACILRRAASDLTDLAQGSGLSPSTAIAPAVGSGRETPDVSSR